MHHVVIEPMSGRLVCSKGNVNTEAITHKHALTHTHTHMNLLVLHSI